MLSQHLSEKLFILARHRGSLVQLFPAITKTGIQAALTLGVSGDADPNQFALLIEKSATGTTTTTTAPPTSARR